MDNAWFSSLTPTLPRASWLITSTGASDSRRVRPSVRVPVTTNSSTSVVEAVWAADDVASKLTADAAANKIC